MIGLILLIVSSRLLVWGAVAIAQSLGVSDLIIGLTIVAIGTSLPELASAIAAVKKNEHDLILGNILAQASSTPWPWSGSPRRFNRCR